MGNPERGRFGVPRAAGQGGPDRGAPRGTEAVSKEGPLGRPDSGGGEGGGLTGPPLAAQRPDGREFVYGN